MYLIKTGRLFFTIVLIAFGIEHFIFGDFVTGRAPAWPSGVPGRLAWAWLSGTALIIAGVAMAAGRRPRMVAVLVGTLIFLWALLRHIPVVAAHLQWGAELTSAGKALALCGGALAVAGSLPEDTGTGVFAGIVNASGRLILAGRVALGVFLMICGIEHFTLAEFVKHLVPSWIPGNLFWTYFTGVALIAGGAGLMFRQTVRLAAMLSGIMIFVWFIVLHIPRAVAAQNDGNEWIAVVEALAMSGIAFVLAGTAREQAVG